LSTSLENTPLGGLKKKKGRRDWTEVEWNFSADDAYLLGDSLNALKKYTKALLDSREEVGLEIATEKTKNMLSTRILGKILPCLLTYGAEPFLRSCPLCSHSENSQQF
jgi:hypothetical protein